MKNLKVYQQAVQFYKNCKALNCECHLKTQLLRAASSAVLNTAEGYGKFSPADKLRFWRLAFGSIRECQSILDLTEPGDAALAKHCDILAAMMYKLMRAV